MFENWKARLSGSKCVSHRASSNLMIEATPGFSVEVVRTRRKKTVAIKITDGRVQVMAPKRLPQKHIDDLIVRKTAWIENKLQMQAETVPVKARAYISGESFTYLGDDYRLKLTEDDCREITLGQGQLMLGIDEKLPDVKRENYVRKKLIQWYRENAEMQLKEKIEHYAKIISVEPRSVIVKTYKARWGSCSIEGDIYFNWKLIIAPHRIVDYVVVHELCHMHQHNHSSRFWSCVEQVMPDYRERRQWLKENQRYLDI